ncbi:MAG TPA: hypothetical protein PLB10_07190, partial [Thiolinea sp.]|nr:hypothetical protein [Thiolinea sp.]
SGIRGRWYALFFSTLKSLGVKHIPSLLLMLLSARSLRDERLAGFFMHIRILAGMSFMPAG